VCCFSETLVNFCWTTRHHILEDINFHHDDDLQDVVPRSMIDTKISENLLLPSSV
jgi:hypothetical protein